jgi:ribosomal protein S12 methylthiotransferase accessory factor
MELLLHEGHVMEAQAAPRCASAFWSEFGLEATAVASQLRRCRVEVLGFGAVNVLPLILQLTAAGVPITNSRCNARIVVVDDYARPEIASINHRCLTQGVPYFLLKPNGVRIWIGPLVRPGRTACWQCLKTRLADNRPVETFLEARTGAVGPFPVNLSRTVIGELQAYAAASIQIVHWLASGANPNLESRMITADLVTFEFVSHHVLRLPDCPACGDPTQASNAGKPILLASLRATIQEGAGDRSEPPDITFERLKHHISPLTGIVSHLEKSLWYGRGPIRTYIAGHNFALKNNSLWFLKDGLRTHSSGKGWTDTQARTSALCEAIERHSGVYRGNEPRLLASLRDLGEAGIDPRSAMLFSSTQYRDREHWLSRRSRFQNVPLPFDDAIAMHWTPTWSISRKRVRYLPTSYLYYNYNAPEEPSCCWADSNGAAAGRTLLEAMQQGLFELIERDAISIWWYNRLQMREVDLSSFGDANIALMQEFFDQVGRDLWVLDLTSDLNIPVFVAISRRRSAPTEDLMMGFGAHLNARVALARALTELNQFIPALLNVGPDGRTAYAMGDHEAVHWWTTATLENQPYLGADRTRAPRKAKDYKAPDADPVALFELTVRRLEQKGLEVIALDQTRPGVELAVAKMIVPGLRHFWARFAPGRLYDIPVELGLLKTPTPEHELNPIPMFL